MHAQTMSFRVNTLPLAIGGTTPAFSFLLVCSMLHHDAIPANREPRNVMLFLLTWLVFLSTHCIYQPRQWHAGLAVPFFTTGIICGTLLGTEMALRIWTGR